MPVNRPNPDIKFPDYLKDIAVDGWALTMLSEKNVGWASTCNAVGQTAGYFLGNVVFLALESADFSNKWLRSADQQSEFGVVTLSQFVYFWGIVFMVSTTMVLIFKVNLSIGFGSLLSCVI